MPHDDTTPQRIRTRVARQRVEQPATYAFMDSDAWLDFHCELYDVVEALALRVDRIEPGVIRFCRGDSMPLVALVEQCHGRPREDWPVLIERYVTGMSDLLGLGDDAETIAAPASIELRVRLVSENPIDGGVLAAVGARHVAEGIAAVLAVGTREGSRIVSEGEIVTLGWDVDETWASAWAQTKLLEEPDELDAVDINGVDVVHLFGCSEFTATLACSLEHHLGPLGEHGAIVALPCDHTVLVHPIDGPASRRAIGTLVPIVRRLHADGPGSLSPQLYWWRAGTLTWIPTVFGGSSNEVYLPAGLGDVLS